MAVKHNKKSVSDNESHEEAEVMQGSIVKEEEEDLFASEGDLFKEEILDSEEEDILDLEEDMVKEETLDSEEEDILDLNDKLEEEETPNQEDDLQTQDASKPEEVEETSDDDLSDFTPIACNVTTKTVGEETMLSIVNTLKCGHRITIARSKVLDEIGVEDTVQVAYSKMRNAIILGKNLNGQDYNLKKMHGKAVIYNRALVETLTDMLGLDFSNRTTVSFTTVEFKEYGEVGCKLAIIPVGGEA